MKKLLIILMLAFSPAWAAKVSSIYEADLLVATQSEEERAQAVEQGLEQVLIKLSGDPLIEKNPAIKSSVHKADYYVQEFSYASSTTSSSQYLLQIYYDKEA